MARRRGSGGMAVLVLAACLALWVAWLTGHPDSRTLDWVGRWRPLAPWAERFREIFGAAEPAAAQRPSGVAPRPELVVLPAEPRGFEARPRVWVPEGTELRAGPEEDAPAMARVEAISNLAVVERRGDWYRVRGPGPAGAAGWVRLPAYRERGAAPASPQPALPLPAVAPDPEPVAAARSRMRAGGRELRCGGYRLITDSDSGTLPALCDRVVARLDAFYADTFGVEPVGEPAEAILLFGDGAAFQRFAREVSDVPVGYAGHARAARGYVALPVGPLETTVRTLVHELTHLVSRRALGPALPRWLSEGVADLLGDRAGPEGLGTVPGIRGAEGEIERLQSAYEAGIAGSLERLAGLGPEEFDGSRPSFDYEQSAFFVRFLLADRQLASRFRAYLRGLAAGAGYAPGDLPRALGVDWATLERRFELWVRTVRLPARPEAISLGSAPGARPPATSRHRRRSAPASRSAPRS